jgi:hypothetical protein
MKSLIVTIAFLSLSGAPFAMAESVGGATLVESAGGAAKQGTSASQGNSTGTSAPTNAEREKDPCRGTSPNATVCNAAKASGSTNASPPPTAPH